MLSPALHLRPAVFLLGVLLVILALFMCLPVFVGLFMQEPIENFALAATITLFIGGLLVLAHQPESTVQLQVKTAFFFTTLAWTTLILFSSLPFLFSELNLPITTGIFEAVSALTTTGLSVFSTPASMPMTLFVWRSLLQWLGGIGIAIMALTLFPLLGIGGMQLFVTESSHHYEKVLPRVSQIATFLLTLYFCMTILCIALLFATGIPLQKAFYYGVSTVSTSGASLMGEQTSGFNSPYVIAIMTTFMLLSASPLLLLVRLFQGKTMLYTKDSQIRTYFKTACFAVLSLTLITWLTTTFSFLTSFKKSCFQAISMLTTSGFQTPQQISLPPLTSFVCLLLCTIGGCTGSTAGGIKIFRFQLIYQTIRSQIYKMILPHGVFTPTFNKNPVQPQAIYAVLTLVVVYIISFCAFSLCLIAFNMSIPQALEITMNTLSNCGANFFNIDMNTLPQSIKLIMSFGMLLGRLEFLTVLILFVPSFWRR